MKFCSYSDLIPYFLEYRIIPDQLHHSAPIALVLHIVLLFRHRDTGLIVLARALT